MTFRPMSSREDGETFHVKSESNPDITYMVYFSKQRGWTCDCKGFLFTNKCKHIDYIIKEYGFN